MLYLKQKSIQSKAFRGPSNYEDKTMLKKTNCCSIISSNISAFINNKTNCCKLTVIIIGLPIVFFCITSLAEDYKISDYLDTKIVLFPIQESTVSGLVDSFINKFCYREGQEFKKGDILVELDNNLYKQSSIKAKAELVGAEASYKYANDIYKHNIKLHKQNAIGSQELDKSKLDKIEAQSNLELAKANMIIADIKLNSCSIKAPFSGRITTKELHEYDYVRTGQPILQIINDHKLLAVMYIPSSHIDKIKLGMKIKFKIDETNTECTGKVYEIAGSIDPSSRSFEVKVIIDNSNRKLLAGMSGKLLTTY
jgi:membrane fusion protein, multidrug efflux system